MKKNKLIHTDLFVSALCLGTAEYGLNLDDKECFKQLDLFYEYGGNFIDTAHIYNDWVDGERSRSEKVIGKWLKERKNRDEIVVATKGGHPIFNKRFCSRINEKELQKDIDESLTYLQTDYIDLYFLHRDDVSKTVEEIMSFMHSQIEIGKIRYFGCSNWSLERIQEAQEWAKQHNSKGFVCNQMMWSLAEINKEKIEDKTLVIMDNALHMYHKEHQMSAMAYTSQAKGYFSKLIKGEVIKENIKSIYDMEINRTLFNLISVYAEEKGITVGDIGLAYINQQPFSSIPIVACRNKDQLMQCIKGIEISLDSELLKKIEEIKLTTQNS